MHCLVTKVYTSKKVAKLIVLRLNPLLRFPGKHKQVGGFFLKKYFWYENQNQIEGRNYETDKRA